MLSYCTTFYYLFQLPLFLSSSWKLTAISSHNPVVLYAGQEIVRHCHNTELYTPGWANSFSETYFAVVLIQRHWRHNCCSSGWDTVRVYPTQYSHTNPTVSLLLPYLLSCISSSITIYWCPHNLMVSFFVPVVLTLWCLYHSSSLFVLPYMMLYLLFSLSALSCNLGVPVTDILINPKSPLTPSSATCIHHTVSVPFTHPCFSTSIIASPLPFSPSHHIYATRCLHCHRSFL